jgi:hypothetical protein
MMFDARTGHFGSARPMQFPLNGHSYICCGHVQKRVPVTRDLFRREKALGCPLDVILRSRHAQVLPRTETSDEQYCSGNAQPKRISMSPAKAMLWRPPHDEVQRSAVWGDCRCNFRFQRSTVARR